MGFAKALSFFVAFIAIAFLLNSGTARAASSLNWAGYVAASGKFTSVTGTWNIPKVQNSKKYSTDAAWVGIGGVKNTDLIQAGTEAQTGLSGNVNYRAWYELLPDYSQTIPVLISSGDSITVDISQIAKNKWKIFLRNNTTGEVFLKTVNYFSSLSSAEWIEETPSLGDSMQLPLDNFKQVRFSNAFAIKNSKRLSILKSGAQKVSMSKLDGRLLAAASKLGSDGASFVVKRFR